MNRILSHPIDPAKAKKFSIILMLLLFVLPVLLNSVLVIPLYATLDNDIAYDESPIPILLKYTQEFLDLLSFASAYSLIILFALVFSKKATKSLILIYTITFASQIPIKILMNAVVYHSLGDIDTIVTDLVMLLIYFALQMLQLLLIYFIATTDSEKYFEHLEYINKKKGISDPSVQTVLPLSKFFDWYNPLLRSATKMSILILAVKLGARLINDISYGLPQSLGEVMIMCAYYLSDLLYGVIAYVIALLIFTLTYEKNKKAE